MPNKPSPSLSNLEPGDHLCCIYRTEEEHRAVITPFLRQGLEQSHKIIYIDDTHNAENIISYLRKDGLDVDLYLDSGQLSIAESRDTYLRDGVFDPDAMIGLLRAETEKCLAEGYKALRVTGEMTWALGEHPGSERLIEYEAKLNDLFTGSRCLGICQYDRRRFGADLLLGVLTMHPLTVIGEKIYDNFYYLPPDELLGPAPEETRLNRLLANLDGNGRSVEALRESEERYKALFDRSLDVVYLIDFEGYFIDANPAALDLLGYVREDLPFTNMALLISEDQLGAAFESMEALKKIGNQPQTTEFKMKKKNGEDLYLETRGSLIYRHGAPYGIMGIGRDLTKRKQAEEDLRRERDLVSRIMETSPVGIMVIDREGRIIFTNDQAEQVLGVSKDEITQRTYDAPKWRCTHLDGRPIPEDQMPFRLAMNTGQAVHDVRQLMQRPDGQNVFLSINASPMFDQDGRVDGVVDTLEDITERLMAEKTLQASEKKFKNLINSNLDGVIVLNKKGEVLYVNPATEELFGRPAEQFFGQTIGFPTVDGERTDIQIIKKNREIALAEMRVVKTKWEDKTAYLASLRDITARKRAEEALRASETQYRRLFEAAQDGILILDADNGQVIDVNPFLSQLLGYPPAAFRGKTLWEIGFIGDIVASKASFLELQNKGYIRYEDLPLETGDGRRVEVEFVSNAYMVNSKKVIQCNIRDISERKRAEERLQEQFNLLQALINNVPSAVFIKDTQGRYLGCNQPFSELLGASRDELVGKTVYDLTPKEVADQVSARDEALLRNPGKQIYEMESRHADGSLRNILFQRGTFTNAEGELAGIVGVLTDMTEMKAMERRLFQAQKLESIGQLAAGIAHEINTPTQFIHGNVEFLDETMKEMLGAIRECRRCLSRIESGGDPGPTLEALAAALRDLDLDFLAKEVPEAVNGCLEGVDRIAKIVESMRYFAHPGRAEKQPLDVNLAVQNAVTISRNAWKYHADLTTDLAPDLPPWQAFTAEFSQVLLNIIVNAAHAVEEAVGGGEDKGLITVGTAYHDGWIEIRISDTGPGIPKEIRSRIFDPFFTTKGVGKGTGQGLAMAHSVIVDKHGGTIDFETRMGQGTTFIIRVPVEGDQRPQNNNDAARQR